MKNPIASPMPNSLNSITSSMLLDDSMGLGSTGNIVPFQDSKKAKTMNKFKTNTTVDMPKKNSKSGDLNTNADEEHYRALLNNKGST